MYKSNDKDNIQRKIVKKGNDRDGSREYGTNYKRLAIVVLGVVISIGVIFTYGIEPINSKEKKQKNLEIELNDLHIVEPQYKWGPDMQTGNNPKMLIVHHSASEEQTAEEIHEEHKAKGWDGIGYNFYIRKDGTIYRGRPQNSVGAHTYKKNKESLGICLEGNFESDKLYRKQRKSLENLLTYLSKKYGTTEIVGHRDEYDTLCPGTNISIEDIKSDVIKGLKN